VTYSAPCGPPGSMLRGALDTPAPEAVLNAEARLCDCPVERCVGTNNALVAGSTLKLLVRRDLRFRLDYARNNFNFLFLYGNFRPSTPQLARQRLAAIPSEVCLSHVADSQPCADQDG
jgi:hypothetical protein